MASEGANGEINHLKQGIQVRTGSGISVEFVRS